MKSIKLTLKNGKVIFKELPIYLSTQDILNQFNENKKIKYYDENNKENFCQIRSIEL